MTERSTASILATHRKELVAGGISEDLADRMTLIAAQEVADQLGVVTEPAEPVGTVELIPDRDGHLRFAAKAAGA